MEDDSDSNSYVSTNSHVPDRNSYVSTNSYVSDEPEIFINTEDLRYALLHRENYPPINTWEVSQIRNMSYLFSGLQNFNEDISNWDVSNVTTMKDMFYNVRDFNQDISNWDVSSVRNMAGMFNNAISFNCNISNWDVSSVEDMSDMFYEANAFNQDISNWNVSNVEDMESMFGNATSFNQNISRWDVSNVTNMDYMFDDAVNFEQSLESWNVPKLITFGATNSRLTKLFTLPSTLEELDISNCQLTTLPELPRLRLFHWEGNPFEPLALRQIYKFYHGHEAPPNYPIISPLNVLPSTSLDATRLLLMKYGERTNAIVQDSIRNKSELTYLMSSIHNMYQKIKRMEKLGVIKKNLYEALTELYNHCRINLYNNSLTFTNNNYDTLSSDKKVINAPPYVIYKMCKNNKDNLKNAIHIAKDIEVILIHMRIFNQQFQFIRDPVEKILNVYEPHGRSVDLPDIPDIPHIPIPEYDVLTYPKNRQLAQQLLGHQTYDEILQSHTKKIGTYKDIHGTQHTIYDDPYMMFNVLCINEAGRILYPGEELYEDDEWQTVTVGGVKKKSKHKKRTSKKSKRYTRKR